MIQVSRDQLLFMLLAWDGGDGYNGDGDRRWRDRFDQRRRWRYISARTLMFKLEQVESFSRVSLSDGDSILHVYHRDWRIRDICRHKVTIQLIEMTVSITSTPAIRAEALCSL